MKKKSENNTRKPRLRNVWCFLLFSSFGRLPPIVVNQFCALLIMLNLLISMGAADQKHCGVGFFSVYLHQLFCFVLIFFVNF